MKIFFLLFVVIMLTGNAFSQSQTEKVKVTLNDGKELLGFAKSIDLQKSVTLNIGGIDVPIDINEVSKIEIAEAAKPQLATPTAEEIIIVTDNNEYPDSIELTIGSQKVNMRLIRGGVMLMGFDGDHSWAMCSEPVHKVGVTSFYMSDEYIRVGLIGDWKRDTSHDYMYTYKWKEVDEYVKEIASKLNLPLRLPTEAEWEFSTYSSAQSDLFKDFRDSEWCMDFFDDYDD